MGAQGIGLAFPTHAYCFVAPGRPAAWAGPAVAAPDARGTGIVLVELLIPLITSSFVGRSHAAGGLADAHGGTGK
jgi:hypothetical protein